MDMITVEMVREKGFDVAEGDNVWRDIANEFIPISRVEARWIKEKIINSCSAIKEFAWRDNDGEMPCDGELWVEVKFRDGEKFVSIASGLGWIIRNNSKGDIIKWRPSLKNWESEMNLDKIETQEEKEAFEGMVNSSEVPNSSEWDGEGLPPVGVECEAVFIHHKHKGYGEFLICGYYKNYVWMEYIGNLSNKSKHYTAMVCDVAFRKPETPEQKAERERLEFIDSMFVELNPRGVKELYEGHRNSNAWKLCAKAYDAGYRKQNG